MTPFVGFPSGKTRLTPLPDLFFTDLLAEIRDLDELKVLLYLFYYLNRQTGYPRYMTMAELEAEGLLLSALKHQEEEPQATLIERLHEAVDKCVARRTILRLDITNEEGTTIYLFANTPQGRQAIEEVRRGELILEKRGVIHEPHIAKPRPTIFELYEQNIGLLQPLLVEDLQEAERDYPPEWIEEAFRIAAENNARSWRYIKAILERWASEGKDSPESLGARSGRRRKSRRFRHE